MDRFQGYTCTGSPEPELMILNGRYVAAKATIPQSGFLGRLALFLVAAAFIAAVVSGPVLIGALREALQDSRPRPSSRAESVGEAPVKESPRVNIGPLRSINGFSKPVCWFRGPLC